VVALLHFCELVLQRFALKQNTDKILKTLLCKVFKILSVFLEA
jgi:hypothetical protein